MSIFLSSKAGMSVLKKSMNQTWLFMQMMPNLYFLPRSLLCTPDLDLHLPTEHRPVNVPQTLKI